MIGILYRLLRLSDLDLVETVGQEVVPKSHNYQNHNSTYSPQYNLSWFGMKRTLQTTHTNSMSAISQLDPEIAQFLHFLYKEIFCSILRISGSRNCSIVPTPRSTVNTTQPKHYSWVGHKNDCAHPPHPSITT